MSFEDFISNINEEDLKRLNEEFYKRQNQIPTYQYSKITFNQLEELVEITQNIAHNRFDDWFNSDINIKNKTVDFLQKLIEKEKHYIKVYNEEDLKVNFIIPVLNKVDFKIEGKIRGFYEEPITYKTDKFIFNGTTDFLVSTGFRKPKKPYFFIQEFKKGQTSSFPEPQLLTELIAAVELNSWREIKGAYIVGAIWNFVILEKIEVGQYQYFVSENFDCTKIDDLKNIFKSLLFVKNEIIETAC